MTEHTIYTLESQQSAKPHWNPPKDTLAILDFTKNRERYNVRLFATFPSQIMDPYIDQANHITGGVILHDRYILRLGDHENSIPLARFDIHPQANDPTHPWRADSQPAIWLDEATRNGVNIALSIIGQKLKEAERVHQ